MVGHLLSAGVEYDHVDSVALRKTFYSGNSDAVVTPIPCEGLPPVASDFDTPARRQDILDRQRHGQKRSKATIFQPSRPIAASMS